MPLLKPNWFSDRLFSPSIWLWSLCRIKSSSSFPIVSNRNIGLWDEALSRGFSLFLRRTNLYFLQSSKTFLTRRQELKGSRKTSRYTIITFLRISFGTPLVPGAVLAFFSPVLSLLYLEYEKLSALDCAGTSVLSWKWSLDDYFESETP